MNLEKKISEAVSIIIAKNSGLGYIVLKKEPVVIKEAGTAHTNGKQIFLCKNFCTTLTVQELAGIILHEAMHIQLLHFWRFDFLNAKNKKIINYATDFAINSIIIDNLKMKLPTGCLYNIDYKNMSAEQILKILKENENGDDNGDDKQNCQNDHEKSAKKIKDMTKQSVMSENEIIEKIMQDTEIAGMINKGNLPGELSRLISNFKKIGKINWQQLIKNQIKSLDDKSSDNWQRPNKSYRNRGIIMPTKTGQSGKIAIAIDTSGSIDNTQLTEFFNEIFSLQAQLKNIEIMLINCDCRIQAILKLKEQKSLTNEMIRDFLKSGGGGTSHKPVFELAKKEKMKQLFIFSDFCSDIEQIQKKPALFSGMSVFFCSKKENLKKFTFGRNIVIN